jgi:prevent-host-death family protein
VYETLSPRPSGRYSHYDYYALEEVRMTRKVLSVAEAKATLSDAIRDIEHGGTVVITRRGKPVAALVRAEDAAVLARLQAAGPQSGLASIAGGWKDSDELVANIAAAPRQSRRRGVKLS